MLVSLFTDASYAQPGKKLFQHGGWGAWIKCDRGQIHDGGPILSEIRECFGMVMDINCCETIAVLEGLVLGIRTGLIHNGDTILVQLDNQHVCRSLPWRWHPSATYPKAQRRPDYKRSNREAFALDCIDELICRHSLVVATRHVKGHQRSDKPRNYVNNLCDRLARRGRHLAKHYTIISKKRQSPHQRKYVHNLEKLQLTQKVGTP